jgi:hypothetical protein
MSQYYTDDFSGFSIGSTWTRRWETPTGADWAVSGGELSCDRNTGQFPGVSWDTVGDAADVDILVKVKTNSLTNWECLFARGSGAAGSPTCYSVRLSSSNLILNKHTAVESYTSIGSSAYTFQINTYYWVRLRINSDDITVTAWAEAGSESSPLATVTVTNDTSITDSGWLGPLNYGGDIVTFDMYAVGTNGDIAPSSAPKNVSHLLCLGTG